jgi:hypothetical protein
MYTIARRMKQIHAAIKTPLIILLSLVLDLRACNIALVPIPNMVYPANINGELKTQVYMVAANPIAPIIMPNHSADLSDHSACRKDTEKLAQIAARPISIDISIPLPPYMIITKATKISRVCPVFFVSRFEGVMN